MGLSGILMELFGTQMVLSDTLMGLSDIPRAPFSIQMVTFDTH